MTLNFYVYYLVPVPPQEIQKIQDEILRCELAYSDYPEHREEINKELARLRAQMEPERRREPAIIWRIDGSDAQSSDRDWTCPACGVINTEILASVRNGMIVKQLASCPGCGAEVHKEMLPMDLYRMRTRRTDGVEVQAKPQT